MYVTLNLQYVERNTQTDTWQNLVNGEQQLEFVVTFPNKNFGSTIRIKREEKQIPGQGDENSTL